MLNLKGCKIAVFDMDNCIIDDRHRQHLIDMAAPLSERYKRYHEAMIDDKPFPFGAALIKHLANNGWKILINTARPRHYNYQTSQQLMSTIGIPSGCIIGYLMRDKEDFGIPSNVLKPKKLAAFIEAQGIETAEIITFDDRPDVVDAYTCAFPVNNKHFLLTGSTLISAANYFSMRAADNAFAGKKLERTENAFPSSWNRKYEESIPVTASDGARSWLQAIYPGFRHNEGDSRAWEESDFPGAELYNKKRPDFTSIQIEIGQQPPFIKFPELHSEGQRSFIGVDLAKEEDVSALIKATLDIPPHLLYGRPKATGPNCRCTLEPVKPKTAAEVLSEMADTFRERNAVYKDNAGKVGEVMEVLFPDGITLKTAADHKFYHLFELLIVKLTRFTNSGLKHEDSIHDLTVYGAMLEAIGVLNHNIQTGTSEDKTK